MPREADSGTVGEPRICLGQVVGAHGIKGLVRIRPFTAEPCGIAAYGALEDERRRRFTLEVVGRAKGCVLARVEGVSDRDAAEALAGTRLYVERAALPAIEEEETYYQADLIGLRAEDPQGRPMGRIVAVHDFGAGDVLEVERAPDSGHKRGDSLLVPFTRANVPLVDLPGGRVVVSEMETTEAGEASETGSGKP